MDSLEFKLHLWHGFTYYYLIILFTEYYVYVM